MSNTYNMNFPLGGLISVVTPQGGVIPYLNPANSANLLGEPYVPSATPKEMGQAIAVDVNAFLLPGFRLPRYNPDVFTRNKGYAELRNLLTMSVVDMPFMLLNAAILSKEWRVEPRVDGQVVSHEHPRYQAAQEVADSHTHVLRNILHPRTGLRADFRETLWYLLDAVKYGFAVLERARRPLQYNGKTIWGYSRFTPRAPEAIGFELDPYTLEVLALNNWTPLGPQYNLPTEKFVLFTYKPSENLPYGNGLLRRIYKHALAIMEAYRVYGIKIDRDAAGFLEIVTLATDQKALQDIRALAENVRQGGVFAHGPSLTVTNHQSQGTSGNLALEFIQMHATAIVKEVLGQDLTTGTGGGPGSYALGGIHEGTQKHFIGYPRQELEAVVTNQIVAPLHQWNFGAGYDDVLPHFSLGFFDLEEMQAVAKIAEIYIQNAIGKPDEPIWRIMPNLPPMDSQMTGPVLLPGRERITVDETPSGGTPAATKGSAS